MWLRRSPAFCAIDVCFGLATPATLNSRQHIHVCVDMANTGAGVVGVSYYSMYVVMYVCNKFESSGREMGFTIQVYTPFNCAIGGGQPVFSLHRYMLYFYVQFGSVCVIIL